MERVRKSGAESGIFEERSKGEKWRFLSLREWRVLERER